MPKLRRMRLVSIGYGSARFEDVTLRFTDRDGRPTNSILWLRNGGGKSSLLSLFFAGLRPSKRDFLGQRAEEKIRRIGDYVGPRDHGAVVCEWELDAEKSLFEDGPQRYLTGVFYQRSESASGNGDTDVDRLFFATLVSASEPELTLDGLPFLSEQAGNKTRRTLSGFRRQLRQLNQEHPENHVFIEDKNQTAFQQELDSRGIDTESFYYQILMNEREAGVSERFSFAEDEDFVDFLLEMAFDQQHARKVREQLSTFRQDIVERNEQLKPELEYCQGLIVHLHKLTGIARERADASREIRSVHAQLASLKIWALQQMTALDEQCNQLEEQRKSSERFGRDERENAQFARGVATVLHRHACRLRCETFQGEYDDADRERLKAKRQKEIWGAAVPLARVWAARRDASDLREQLNRKLQEFAPDLHRLTEAATVFANGLQYEIETVRGQEEALRLKAEECRLHAEQSREEGTQVAEQAAQKEKHVEHLQKNLDDAVHEENLLRSHHVLNDEDKTAAEAATRIQGEMEANEAALADERNSLSEILAKQTANAALREQAIQRRGEVEKQQLELNATWQRALGRRAALAQDVALLRLLQTDHIDAEAAASGAVLTATEELKRVQETLLRIAVEAAEDERAMHFLTDSGLMPPASDVQTVVDWFRERGITSWSGWQYIERNVSAKERREVIGQLPYLAAGVIVATNDYDSAMELLSATANAPPAVVLRSPVVIAPADAISDKRDLLWTVLGPTSDAHFDIGAGAQELVCLQGHKSRRTTVMDDHRRWQFELTELKVRLQAFTTEYPRGWFADQRQKLDVIASRLEDVLGEAVRLKEQFQGLENDAGKMRQRIEAFATTATAKQRDLDRIHEFVRRFECHMEKWRDEQRSCRESASQLRQRQRQLRQKASDEASQATDADRQVNVLIVQASRLSDNLSKVRYQDDSQRRATAGEIEALRRRYESLVADYEGKVNAESLTQIAHGKDLDADREEREFHRILGRSTDLAKEEIEEALRGLPQAMTAQEKLEHSQTSYEEMLRKLGPLANRLKGANGDLDNAELECAELELIAPLPTVSLFDKVDENEAKAQDARKQAAEHALLAKAFDEEAAGHAAKANEHRHEKEKLEKDDQRLDSLQRNYAPLFNRLPTGESGDRSVPSAPRGNAQLGLRVDEIDRRLNIHREQYEALDARREKACREISLWSRHERFQKLKSSISHRFVDRDVASSEARAELDITQLGECVFQIEEKLKEADKQRDIVTTVLFAAAEEALALLGRVSRMSKLPESLPQAGRQFVKIETKASDNPMERRALVGELIDELLDHGEVGDGLKMVQKAVRRVARRITVRVLHPDLHQHGARVSIADLRRFSGGERLTGAILLYCALMRLRQMDGNRRGGSSVLILDNPIGTASRIAFLDMQREVAHSMNVQLIYATAVDDLNAVGAMENIIRLRNTRADRRTGRRFVEVLDEGGSTSQVEAIRIAFDSAPSSLVNANGVAQSPKPATSNEET